MKRTYRTIKLWPETITDLKMLAALTNSKMAETADRAIRAALELEQDENAERREVERLNDRDKGKG